jgi:hypothetical protein
MGQDTLRTLERSLLDAAAQALGRPDATGLRSADAPSPEVGDLMNAFDFEQNPLAPLILPTERSPISRQPGAHSPWRRS